MLSAEVFHALWIVVGNPIQRPENTPLPTPPVLKAGSDKEAAGVGCHCRSRRTNRSSSVSLSGNILDQRQSLYQ
ncbi:MAG: hypothetical protein ISN28_06890 [Ectothiorhodospiraceae bacterium AqS1]|nr:hypothetical protein [Ectothiorhodospiraceae bacterium AqS1]